MQKSFIVKATLCIEECQFYLRAGDLLMFDAATQRLTVYRGNDIAKILRLTSLGVGAMVKTGILQEVVETSAPTVVVATPTVPSPAVSKVTPSIAKLDLKPAETKNNGFTAEEFTPAMKRGKMAPISVSNDALPDRLKEALRDRPKAEPMPAAISAKAVEKSPEPIV